MGTKSANTMSKELLRGLVNKFPPLKIALWVNDLLCYLFGKFVDGIKYLVGLCCRLISYIFGIVFALVRKACSWLLGQLLRVEFIRRLTESRPYQQLTVAHPVGKVPHANKLLERLFTYHGGLLLALALYIFIYFVLVSHHTFISVSTAIILLLVYLVVIENSHSFRSVIMLCLPIMFTNRGRALVYCSMLAIMTTGPVRSIKHNVGEVHNSLTCCKQYFIVSSDQKVEQDYVKKLVRVEEVVMDWIKNIKEYAREVKEQFAGIIELAIACEQFIIDTVEALKNIVNVCNGRSDEVYKNCASKLKSMQQQCKSLFIPFKYSLCPLVGDVTSICNLSTIPSKLCQLPVEVIAYIERTLGAKLKQYIRVIENEFYVDIDIDRQYSYNLTQSKAFAQVAREIKFDVEAKFWYVHAIKRLFHFITLLLVVFILATAAVYHMHYLKELGFDNMYLDEKLLEIDSLRQLRASLRGARGERNGSKGGKKSATPLDQNRSLISIEDEADEWRSLERLEDSDSKRSYARENSAIRSDEQLGSVSRDDQKTIIDEFDPLTVFSTRTKREEVDGSVSSGANGKGGRLTMDNLERVAELEIGSDREGTTSSTDEDDRMERGEQGPEKGTSLFPLSRKHEQQYLRPFSLSMNHIELSKLKWAGVIWSVIVGYIWFFVVLDFALYSLISLLVEILREILFTSDLPLVDLETRSAQTGGNETIVRYNRTYLSSLRKTRLDRVKPSGAGLIGSARVDSGTNSSINALYRRLMDSIERDIPDDVAILNSLEGCLPRTCTPDYGTYKTLLFLSLLTFVAVIVEAYAMRTRHCIADLYYPDQARARANWLYRRMQAEQMNFEDDPDEEEVRQFKSNSSERKLVN